MSRFKKIMTAKMQPTVSAEQNCWAFQRGGTIRGNSHRAVACVAHGGLSRRVVAHLFYEHEPTLSFLEFIDATKLLHPYIFTASVLTDDMGTKEMLRRKGITPIHVRPPAQIDTELVVPSEATLKQISEWDALIAAAAYTALLDAEGICYI